MEVVVNGIRYMPIPTKSSDPKPLATLLLDARKSRRQSLDEACKGIGIAKSTLWELESGRGCPSVKVLQKLISYYGFDFQQIEAM